MLSDVMKLVQPVFVPSHLPTTLVLTSSHVSLHLSCSPGALSAPFPLQFTGQSSQWKQMSLLIKDAHEKKQHT